MKKLIFFSIFSIFAFFLAFSVQAQNIPVNNTGGTNVPVDNSCPSGSVCLDNPLAASGVDSPQALIGKVINSVLGVVGSLALIMFIYGGLTWMTSAGSADKVKKGRDIIVWSIIGLFIIFSSYILVRLLIGVI